PKKHHQQDNIDMPMLSENGDFLSEEAIAERNDRELLIHQEMDNDEVKKILDDPYAFTTPTSKRHIRKIEDIQESDEQIESSSEAEPEPESEPEEEVRPQIIDREPIREHRRSRYADVDESRHRHFENYGGIDEEDPDVIKLSLALARHEEKSDEEESTEENQANLYPNQEVELEADDSIYEEAPTKTMIMQGYKPPRPSMNSGRSDNNRHQNFHRHQNNDNRNNSNRNRNNRNNRGNGGNSNGGYRDQKKYYNNQRNSNNNFRRRPRRDSRE
ncbi:MAG: hypothetical protein IKO19_09225, partial [Candidatus Riflebacteria bacterium]|nr:hypothetical protein [Candidatus Riflebacteria bacterium]